MHPILKSFFPVADIIAETFGKSCEVVVHDLSQPESSAVYVANGTVTNRQVGQSFDHLVRQVLLNKNFKNDRVSNYIFQTPDGKNIKSSSALIRDEQDDVIGLICINYDLSTYQIMQREIDSMLSCSGRTLPAQAPVDEPIDHDIQTILDSLIQKIIGSADPKDLSRKKCIELVRFMDEKGIFLVKGAVDQVARLMGISKVTVYSYLNEAQKTSSPTEE